jgi:hypothetical protein
VFGIINLDNQGKQLRQNESELPNVNFDLHSLAGDGFILLCLLISKHGQTCQRVSDVIINLLVRIVPLQ